MSKITVETLKRGLESLGLEVNSKKQKELEKQVDEALTDMELGFECPSCSKDIPDVAACPYCGESFEEDNVVDSDSEDEEDVEDAEVENDAEEEVSANEFLDKEINETSKKVAEKMTEKPAKEKPAKEKPVKEKPVKVKNDEDSEKKGRQKIDPEVALKRKEEFNELVSKVDSIVGDKIEKRERKSGMTYVNGTERLFKIVSSTKQIVIEFNVDIKNDYDGLVRYTEEEAKAKHFGSVKSIYSGDSLENALKMIKEIKIA